MPRYAFRLIFLMAENSSLPVLCCVRCDSMEKCVVPIKYIYKGNDGSCVEFSGL
jgi:hypothetical protein